MRHFGPSKGAHMPPACVILAHRKGLICPLCTSQREERWWAPCFGLWHWLVFFFERAVSCFCACCPQLFHLYYDFVQWHVKSSLLYNDWPWTLIYPLSRRFQNSSSLCGYPHRSCMGMSICFTTGNTNIATNTTYFIYIFYDCLFSLFQLISLWCLYIKLLKIKIQGHFFIC
jgi:hypothetical protein